MSTSITTAFITAYEAKVHLVFQRMGTVILQAVRWKRDVTGSTSVFQIIGKGTATTKARHGQITPMNQTHTTATATLADFYAGDWVDALDEAKTNIDERDALARSGAMALGRKIDDQIFTAMDASNDGTTTWTVTTEKNVRAALLNMVEALYNNDVPNDGELFGALSPKQWAFAMTVEEFKNSDYVTSTGLPYTQGAPVARYKEWMGVKWTMHTGVPGMGTSTSKPFLWHRSAIGYASGAHPKNFANRGAVVADVTWHGDRAAHFINHMMSGGAVVIEAAGIREGSVNDTTSVPLVAST